jgi:hypothetical protein
MAPAVADTVPAVPGPFDGFGSAVAVDLDVIAVGAQFEDGSAAGVNGDQSDDGAIFSGAAYVFRRGDRGWAQLAYVKPPVPQTSDVFGFARALSERRLAVSAEGEDSRATAVNGDPTDDGAPDSGAAFVRRLAP